MIYLGKKYLGNLMTLKITWTSFSIHFLELSGAPFSSAHSPASLVIRNNQKMANQNADICQNPKEAFTFWK